MNRWLPGALPYGGQVTVGELLNHTSGIPEYLDKIAELYATRPGSWLLAVALVARATARQLCRNKNH